MSKYIDADELRKVVEESQDLRIVKDLSVTDRLSLVTAFTSLYTMLRYIQPADVEPVKHGHWEKVVGGVHFPFRCSRCKERADSNEYLYCHCGAKMDEEC